MMTTYPKHSDAGSSDHLNRSGINHGSPTKKTSSIDREKKRMKTCRKHPHAGSHKDDSKSSGERVNLPVEALSQKKERTPMTNKKRLNFLAMLEKWKSHGYGEVFFDIENIREARPESLKALETPMDLDTVKYMLEKNLYSTVEAFAGDVRITFSNAAHIFPATHKVHKMATKLSREFETGFRITVESMDRENL